MSNEQRSDLKTGRVSVPLTAAQRRALMIEAQRRSLDTGRVISAAAVARDLLERALPHDCEAA